MCGPHGQTTYSHAEGGQSCDTQSSKVQIYHHVHTQDMTIKMNGDIDVTLEDDQDNIQAKETNTSSQTMYNSESMHVRLSEQS